MSGQPSKGLRILSAASLAIAVIYAIVGTMMLFGGNGTAVMLSVVLAYGYTILMGVGFWAGWHARMRWVRGFGICYMVLGLLSMIVSYASLGGLSWMDVIIAAIGLGYYISAKE